MSEDRSSLLDQAGVATRTFELSQRIRYGYDAPVSALRQRLMTVPPARHGAQRRDSWHVGVEGADADIVASTDAFGNVAVDVWVPRVERAVEFVVDVEVTVDGGGGAAQRIRPDRRYLRPTALTAPDDAIEALGRGSGGDVAALSAAVHRRFRYEWGVTDVATTAAEALAAGVGVCQDYAHVMLAACRSVGIPARYVSGHLPGEGGSHAWVEVLSPDGTGAWAAEGWDPTHDRRVADDYLVIAVGRDYRDVAPMSGTFDGDGVGSTLVVDKRLAPR